eukprot:656168-Alexandrium_andersonii.AAC.1
MRKACLGARARACACVRVSAPLRVRLCACPSRGVSASASVSLRVRVSNLFGGATFLALATPSFRDVGLDEYGHAVDLARLDAPHHRDQREHAVEVQAERSVPRVCKQAGLPASVVA